MTIAPLRGGPGLTATLKATVPLPAPAAPERIVIHGWSGAAVHAQPAAALTLTVPVPPLDGTLAPDALNSTEHPLSCWTVNVRPAAVTAPVRRAPEFAVVSIRTLPFPLPLAPAAILIQGTSSVAVQLQPSGVRTSNSATPPAAAIVAPSGASVAAQAWP